MSETMENVATPRLLDLNFVVDSNGQAAAYLPVRWCVTPRLLEQLRREQFKNPHLMLTVRSIVETTEFDESFTDRHDTAHYIVPLGQELQYISFNRPGRHEVIGTVVEVNRFSAGKLRKWKREGGADYTKFSENGEARSDCFYDVDYLDTGALETVDVDPNMFAKPRTGWRKGLVDQFFEGKAYDECHFRRRFILSLIYGVGSLVLWPLRLLAVVVVLSLGIRQVNWKCLNPVEWRDGALVETYTEKTSVWIHTKDGEPRSWPWLFVIVNPFVLLTLPLLVLAVLWLFIDAGFWSLLGTAYLYTAGSLVGIGILLGLLVGGTALRDRLSNSRLDARLRKQREEANTEATELDKLYADLASMVCSTGDKLDANVAALPKEKQTIPLRFAALKGKVCKPFAQ